ARGGSNASGPTIDKDRVFARSFAMVWGWVGTAEWHEAGVRTASLQSARKPSDACYAFIGEVSGSRNVTESLRPSQEKTSPFGLIFSLSRGRGAKPRRWVQSTVKCPFYSA